MQGCALTSTSRVLRVLGLSLSAKGGPATLGPSLGGGDGPGRRIGSGQGERARAGGDGPGSRRRPGEPEIVRTGSDDSGRRR